ncbi:MAG: hypothetical protein PF445_10065 [Melioribacteraceae bacterium]|jgi:hypothetical protein|nr:hypothetical protein [Melioribacteraceae bacterium]
MRNAIILFSVLIFTTSMLAQDGKAEWTPVFNEGSDRVFVDISGVANFSGKDIYAWTLTEHSIPIVIESIDDKIYRTNTYYLFNTHLNKYSMLYIIYYDENKNVLASYDYGRNTKVEAYQYNYPIWKGSLEERILAKCVEVIDKKKNK